MKNIKSKSKAHRKRILVSTACVVCILLVCYWAFFVVSDSVEKASSYIVYPLLVVQTHVVKPIRKIFERQKTVEELTHALKTVQDERDTLLARSIELESALLYADQTKELVEHKQRYSVEEAHLAQIIFRQFSDQAHFIFIDKGLNEGIKPNMVAVYKNCLLGRVAEVYPCYSKVTLITDRTCKIAAVCSGTKAPGILEGCNKKDECVLKYVSHLCTVEKEDTVLSSGQGLVFPQGFALGKIKKIERQGLFHEITVEPFVDSTYLEYCYVISKGDGKV